MNSPIIRLNSLYNRQKRCSKLSSLLFIIVIIFCLIIIFTTIFTFDTNYNLGHKIVKKFGVQEISFELPLEEVEDSPENSIDSIGRQLVNESDTHFKYSLPSVSSHLKTSFNDNNTRPRFMTNGSRRLSPLEDSNLILWPEETTDPNVDRIVNQLMFIPINYNSETTPLKSIYLSASDNDWELSLGRKEFLKCPVNSCQFVPRDESKSADLIFFKSHLIYEPFLSERTADQIWAKFESKSPMNWELSPPPHSINWTVTYRHDSEIPVPYYKFYPFEKNRIVYNKRNFAANKKRKVVWVVSNCWADNGRLEYAKRLSEYIPVDIYGDCGTYECPPNDLKCWDLLNKDYKFYLSFENSNCFDYITENFWLNGLKQDMLPIVMGAHPSTYKRVAPPHSYIHVDDYESPKHLAKYLILLNSNDELYNKYFEWKGTGYIGHTFMWCRICAMLHTPPRYKTYSELYEWWYSEQMCVTNSWTNMTLNTIQKQLPLYENNLMEV